MAALGQTRPATATGIRTPLFILGVALALIAFVVMLAFGLLFARQTQSGASISVVVASRDISAREPITADMLTTTSIPTTAAPPKAFLQRSDVTGYSALVDIPKGQAITANLVASNPDQVTPSSYLPISEGWVAMTIPTSEQQGVAGFIAQGDYINIIATVNTQLFTPVKPRQVTRTVFTNVHVVRVGPQTTIPRQGQPQGLTSSITVVMTLCDAQYMDWLAINGTLKYVLLAFKDYSTAPPTRDPSCPSTIAPGVVGPAQVQERYNFLKG